METLCKHASLLCKDAYYGPTPTVWMMNSISSRLTVPPDIQSELHRTKRRFTDFVFQRVLAGGDRTSRSSNPSPSLGPAAQRTLRTPRSVSSLNLSSASGVAPRSATSGVPSVRATSPGAEFREQKRLAAARKEAEEKFTRAVRSSPLRPEITIGAGVGADTTRGQSSALSGQESGAPSPNAPSVRRFQISRPSTPVGFHKSIGSGVQKRRRDSVSGVAVLVEKLKQPQSRRGSMVTNLLTTDGAVTVGKPRSLLASEGPVRPRKRPVVNQAEKRWKEEHRNDISTAKQRIAHMADTSQGDLDDEYERLAQEFEQVALDLESGMDTTATDEKGIAPPSTKSALPKPPLKYQPRVPNRPRPNVSASQAESSGTRTEDAMQVDPAQSSSQVSFASEHGKQDGDDDYVYDTYIRRPLPSMGQLSDPLAELETNQDTWFRQNGIDVSRPDVGVIVIPAEDEQYWENFAEDGQDDDRWDSEDADSNGKCKQFVNWMPLMKNGQLRIILQTTIRTRNCRGTMRTTIRLPFTANIEITRRRMTRNSVFTILPAKGRANSNISYLGQGLNPLRR